MVTTIIQEPERLTQGDRPELEASLGYRMKKVERQQGGARTGGVVQHTALAQYGALKEKWPPKVLMFACLVNSRWNCFGRMRKCCWRRCVTGGWALKLKKLTLFPVRPSPCLLVVSQHVSSQLPPQCHVCFPVAMLSTLMVIDSLWNCKPWETVFFLL